MIGRTDGKISRTQETLRCSNLNMIWNRTWLTRFLRNLSILKDLLVRDGRVEGIASAKFKGSGAAAEASGFGIDLLSIDININIDIDININIYLLCNNNIDVLNMLSTAFVIYFASHLVATVLCSVWQEVSCLIGGDSTSLLLRGGFFIWWEKEEITFQKCCSIAEKTPFPDYAPISSGQ